LPVITKVDRAKKSLVSKRGENSLADIFGKVKDALNSVRIGQPDSIALQRLNFAWSEHVVNMP